MIISTANFFQTKLHEPVGGVQLEVFEKFISANLNQIAREIKLLLINNMHEKSITVSETRRNLTVRVICNLNSCNNFALVLNKCTRFQPI